MGSAANGRNLRFASARVLDRQGDMLRLRFRDEAPAPAAALELELIPLPEKWGLSGLQPIGVSGIIYTEEGFRGALMNSRIWLLGFCQLVLATPFFALVLVAFFLTVGGNFAGAAPAAPPACHHPLHAI
jgi:hypothetical protein